MLERYFKQQLAESYQYRAIGSWWEPKGDQNEIDIVALKIEKNQAVVAEVKRQKKNFKPEQILYYSSNNVLCFEVKSNLFTFFTLYITLMNSILQFAHLIDKASKTL